MHHVRSIKDELRGDNENAFFFMLLFLAGIPHDHYSEKASRFMVLKPLARSVTRKTSQNLTTKANPNRG